MAAWAWVPFVVLVFANIWVGRRWLGLFVAAHPGVVPGYSWVITRDSDPEVETWRRIRVAVVVGEIAALFLALFAFSTIN